MQYFYNLESNLKTAFILQMRKLILQKVKQQESLSGWHWTPNGEEVSQLTLENWWVTWSENLWKLCDAMQTLCASTSFWGEGQGFSADFSRDLWYKNLSLRTTKGKHEILYQTNLISHTSSSIY